MCVPAVRTLVCCVLLLLKLTPRVVCHIPSYMTTPANKVDQHCLLADACVHDTIPICGRMGDETRTFLDLCDLLEYACDTNNIYIHVDDMKGCPAPKEPRQ